MYYNSINLFTASPHYVSHNPVLVAADSSSYTVYKITIVSDAGTDMATTQLLSRGKTKKRQVFLLIQETCLHCITQESSPPPLPSHSSSSGHLVCCALEAAAHPFVSLRLFFVD